MTHQSTVAKDRSPAPSLLRPPRSPVLPLPSPSANIFRICQYLLRDGKQDKARLALPSWLWRSIRATRALLFLAEHNTLSQLDVYRNYLTLSACENLFHHLRHRHYLAKSLSLRQRVRFALTHYRFEAATFDSAYKRAVYLENGLLLWAKSIDGIDVRIMLSLGGRITPEGDLCIALFVDGKRLHSTSFSWISRDPAHEGGPVLPYITRNQGRWPADPETLAKFEAAFPHNSPRYFCLAAMQGLARAVKADRMIGVSSELHICYKPHDIKHFVNAYDAFWESLGASKVPDYGYSIPIPFSSRPLTEVAPKHRKRAANRRNNWTEIDESAHRVITGHMLSPEQRSMAAA